jgi:hypothetical protein
MFALLGGFELQNPSNPLKKQRTKECEGEQVSIALVRRAHP